MPISVHVARSFGISALPTPMHISQVHCKCWHVCRHRTKDYSWDPTMMVLKTGGLNYEPVLVLRGKQAYTPKRATLLESLV